MSLRARASLLLEPLPRPAHRADRGVPAGEKVGGPRRIGQGHDDHRGGDDRPVLPHGRPGAAPKRFRRLANSLRFAPDTSLDCFPSHLFGGANQYRILSQGSTAKALTGLHHVVEVNGGTVRMTHPIEDLVFAEE